MFVFSIFKVLSSSFSQIWLDSSIGLAKYCWIRLVVIGLKILSEIKVERKINKYNYRFVISTKMPALQ